ncbi:MAG: NUDIX domain-containing protein [Alphaproteobacteria bacterium]|nr:NUDIX domain-containing protein [Alphaproteobacteria bacterium]
METKIIAAGGLVINNKNDILLIYRKKYWDLPKGKLEPNETIEESAIREVKEETGLKKVVLMHKLDITEHHYIDAYTAQPSIKFTHWFLMKAPAKQKLIPQAEEGIEDARWINLKKINNYLLLSHENIRNLVANYLKKTNLCKNLD